MYEGTQTSTITKETKYIKNIKKTKKQRNHETLTHSYIVMERWM